MVKQVYPKWFPVLPIAADLIKKYRNYPKCIIHNRLMPIDSNARYNGYLKEIAAICGIKRDLNTTFMSSEPSENCSDGFWQIKLRRIRSFMILKSTPEKLTNIGKFVDKSA